MNVAWIDMAKQLSGGNLGRLLLSACVLATGLSACDQTLAPQGEGEVAAITTASMMESKGWATVSDVSPSESTVYSGDTLQLVALDRRGDPIDARWSSSSPDVADVDQTGRVTALQEGTATVTAYTRKQRASATIHVLSDSTLAGAEPPSDTTTTGSPTPSDSVSRVGFYVATDGSSSADGTAADPWDLATALAGAGGRIQPGDTVWVRGGTYGGTFTSYLAGTSGAPIVVRALPGERAVLDTRGATASGNALKVKGAWSTFWGLELTNSGLDRTVERSHGLYVLASNTKFINLVIHEQGVAVYTDPDYGNVEFYGCIIYNNGWQSADPADRGHGHALYLKNNSGTKTVRDNVLFNQFGYGLHIYSNAGSGKLYNFQIRGNVSFNNGALARQGTSASNNLLVGGYEPADGIVMVENMTYYGPELAGNSNVRLGYGSQQNGSLSFRGNYLVGGAQVLEVGNWSQGTVTGNVFQGAGDIANIFDGTLTDEQWSSNQHLRDPSAKAWEIAGSNYTFRDWQAASGLAATDQATGSKPNAAKVFVRPNQYEAGRGHVVVYNWGGSGSVTADVSGILSVGDRYEVRSVQDLFGAPVASGSYGGGSIQVPMTGVQPAQPVGGSNSPPPITGPDFDVFLVTRAP